MRSQARALSGKRLIKELYEGDSHRAVYFRYGMQETSGRLIAVVIMISGVSLFLRLIQVMFRPAKREIPLPELRPAYDAIHGKACGDILNVPNEGID